MQFISSKELEGSRGGAIQMPSAFDSHRMIANARKAAAAFFIVTTVFLGVTAPSAPRAEAAPLKGLETMKVMGSIHVAMKPGETRRVTYGFMNRGNTTWTRDGVGYISLYTYGPKYRTSVFEHGSWFSKTQPARLMESSVAPGEVGHVEFILKAPNTEGQYYETFQLASEDVAWIPGGELVLNIPVSNDAPSSVTPTSSSPSSTASSEGLSAMILLRSEKSVTAKGGEEVSYTVGIKNTGTVSWNTRRIRTPEIGIAAGGADTRHASWVSDTTLVAKTSDTVEPGALDFVTFTFAAPRDQGQHTVRYVLEANDAVVPDFEIDIPVTVTSNAPKVLNDPVTESPAEDTGGYMEEPIIRVGVLIVDEETDWQVEVSCSTDWELRAGSGELLGDMDANETVTAFYKPAEMKYYFNKGSGLEKTSDYLRFVGAGVESICTIENFDRRVTRGFTHPDNTFRNILEIRYNTAKDRTWMINELPMEYYLRGLAETSNISHLEFQKALITVARTYALYHWERGTKRGPEFFHVSSTADDQVYNGYGQELRTPRLTQSVEATRGRTVTYNGETAITPYFSRSDGRTRDWSEVWYGEVPWAKSVPVPCDVGKTLWGHGVGLSASGALCMANNGEEWDEILKYFYTGIELEKHWK